MLLSTHIHKYIDLSIVSFKSFHFDNIAPEFNYFSLQIHLKNLHFVKKNMTIYFMNTKSNGKSYFDGNKAVGAVDDDDVTAPKNGTDTVTVTSAAEERQRPLSLACRP